MLFRALSAIALVIFTLSPQAQAAGPADDDLVGAVNPDWAAFQKDPVRFMNKPLVKRDQSGSVIKESLALFSDADIKSGRFIDQKKQFRLGSGELASPICNANGVCLDDVMSGRSAASGRVEDFFDLNEFKKKGIKPTDSIKEMDSLHLMEAHLAETPWSDTYWPISQGIIAARYSEPTFAALGHDWKARFDLQLQSDESLSAIATTGTQDQLDSLSPAEKYDLLIGDVTGVYKAGYLTPAQWQEGQTYFSSTGTVEPWMGICHGWAPASFMIPRPKTTVVTPSSTGTKNVTFYPSDLKGLSSYLWAKSDAPRGFLGGRCNLKSPPTDPESGRILDESCFDTNPGNWHVAIVNQIGRAKRSFVMDATYDFEVWNQPIYSYKYTYFNPLSGNPHSHVSSASVAVKDFKNDKFKKYRSPLAVSIIGIQMDVTYVAETAPTRDLTNSPASDRTVSVTYMYDLELDAAGKIIGGEWYSNKHPDFLWLPAATTRATSLGDSSALTGWTPGTPIPAFWRDIAVQTATKYGQPLAAIIEPLVHQASK